MSLKKFIFSKTFFRHLGLAIAIFTSFMLLLMLWLYIYTRHGQERVIPDFTGMTLEEAETASSRERFRLFVTDSVYSSFVPRGTIAEQNPPPGYKAKRDRRINITLNAMNPELATAPELKGTSLRQALAIITTAGFEAGELSYVPDLSVDVVLKKKSGGKEIAAGDTLVRGATIDMVLGSGLSMRRTSIPDLTGKNIEEARNRLLESSLNLGAFVYDTTVVNAADSADAFVYRQNPVYRDDATMRLGERIYLWLSLDSMKLPIDSALLELPDSLHIINDTLFTTRPDTIWQ